MKLLVRNTASGLVPLYDDDYEEKRRLKIGEDYLVEVKRARNIKFHRKYFSLIRCAWDLQSEARQAFFKNDITVFRKTVEIAAGHCEVAYNLSAKAWVEYPKSLAFDKMSGDEFDIFYIKAYDVLRDVFLRHITQEQFEEKLMNY